MKKSSSSLDPRRVRSSSPRRRAERRLLRSYAHGDDSLPAGCSRPAARPSHCCRAAPATLPPFQNARDGTTPACRCVPSCPSRRQPILRQHRASSLQPSRGLPAGAAPAGAASDRRPVESKPVRSAPPLIVLAHVLARAADPPAHARQGCPQNLWVTLWATRDFHQKPESSRACRDLDESWETQGARRA